MTKPKTIEIRSHKDFGNLSSDEIKILIEKKREEKFPRGVITEKDYNDYLNYVIYAYYSGVRDHNHNWNYYECREGCVFAQKVCDIALKRQINAEVKFPSDKYKAYSYIVLNFNW